MKHWLILWKTWTTDEIRTPWPFTIYKQEIEYRSRTNNSKIDIDTVHGIYETLNPDKISKFENDYVAADILATVLLDVDQESTFNQVKQLFTDAELEKCIEVSSIDAATFIKTMLEE